MPAMQRIKGAIESLPQPLRVQCTSLQVMRSVEEASVIAADIDQFIKNFGHLSESGNDLSFAKWEEDPEMVYRMILRTETAAVRSGLFAYDDIRKRGLRTGISLHKLYLKAGRLKLYREQISSLYIFGYGLFRRLFLKLAKELTTHGILKAEDDIFYLKKEEIDALLVNCEPSDISRCQELIIRRKSEMEATKDIVLPPVIYGDDAPVPQTGSVKNLSGVGTSSGTFTGNTRVVKKADDFDKVEKGDIILIPFSDVSWTPILVKAGAIVSETGGMLSHCSIIAREMGIPALVSVSNACAIGNGLKVTVDGSNGVLTVHNYE
jgi:pyruvate,water dikinase